MAVGLTKTTLWGRPWVEGYLLEDSTDVTNGVWYETRGFDFFAVQVSGINGDTMKIHSSCAATAPDAATAEVVEHTITADGTYYVVGPNTYMKASQTVNGTGTVDVRLVGLSEAKG